jgi:tRNA1Val (adenine37-N6)-methyltransferase
MGNPIIRKDEVLEKLGLAEYYILQKKEGYRFTIDPILLAGFAETGYHDKILDLGTGGGILPFLLQKNNPEKNLTITGIDIQREYIEMALRSKIINKTDSINFLEMDIKNIPANFRNSFNVIITNPPFFKVNEGKINQKKEIALARHELEVSFLQIIKAAAFSLKDNGKFYFIHRSERLMEIGRALTQEGLSISRLRLIYNDEKTPSKLFLGEAVKRKNPQLKVSPPLIIYDDKGNYKEEVRCLYD